LLDLLSAEQLLDWYRYERHIGRFGRDRDDIHYAAIASTVANAIGGAKVSPERYMPYFDRYLDDWDGEAIKAMIAGIPEAKPNGNSSPS
jgi:hypothetical protein